jgi:predicted patatin/cPLA2 family phospholipase
MVDQSSVVSRLLMKRDLLQRGDPAHAHIKTGLLIAGGGMSGVYAAGVATALHHLGLIDSFDHLVGISAGAACCAYFLSDQPRLGTSLFYEEFATKRFINPYRVSNIMNMDYLIAELRYGKPLDVARIRASRSNLHIGVTNICTGACELLDVTNESMDIVSAIAASCSLPGITSGSQCVNGTAYTDGIVACGLPVAYALDTLKCTDLLVVLNGEFAEVQPPPPLAERVVVSFLARKMPRAIRKGYRTRNRLYNEAAALIRSVAAESTEITIGVIAPTRPLVGPMTTDAVLLRLAAQQGASETLRFFGSDEPITIHPSPNQLAPACSPAEPSCENALLSER